MYCTSCGSNLGSWTNRSCPRCGAPLRPTDPDTPKATGQPSTSASPSTPTPTSTPSPVPARRHTGLFLISCLAIFGAIVASTWFVLGMGKVSFDDPANPKPPIPAPPNPFPPEPPLPEPPMPEPPSPEPPSPEPPSPEPPSPEPPSPEPPSPEPPLPEPPPPEPPSPGTHLPGSPPPGSPPPRPRPRLNLSALRSELDQCDNFGCKQQVQERYCPGYWNRVSECISVLHR
jgi:hypothetical protein